MKFSEKWLREWVNPPISTEQLTHQLTMAGFELESIVSTAPSIQHVLVGEVLETARHPDADRLTVCKVNVGQREPLTIVCGAPNVRNGLKVAVILVGGQLPGNITIKKTKLRGVESHGMICSERELALSENQDGKILELPSDAPIGMDINQYLNLDDHMIDIAITPNRGDCLSIRGIAREVAALNQLSINEDKLVSIKSNSQKTFNVRVVATNACPRYLGRVMTDVKNDVHTPVWLRECLRRSGIRSVNPVVDVMNYIMLLLGQPMHAFDLEKLHQEIQVRLSTTNEKITLIDGKAVTLPAGILVIADQNQVQAIAGVMGAANSATQAPTRNLFLESAFFTPSNITLTIRRLGLQSESAYRFERGVDFDLQKLAIERATELLLKIVGGVAGPVVEICHQDQLPQNKTVTLRRTEIVRWLGITIEDNVVMQILSALGMKVIREQDRWQVKIPSYRFDITDEVDLIEELARLHGYARIPEAAIHGQYTIPALPETRLAASQIRQLLVNRSYHEMVTFSFVDKTLNALVNPQLKSIALMNPITQEMGEMRTSLWPGLINVLRYNEHRQVGRIRLFEIGMCFWIDQPGQWQQMTKLGGLITGDAHTLQWGEPKRTVDFYDAKGDVSALLALTREDDYQFVSGTHQALHPGQMAVIQRQGCSVGYLGALHPKLVSELGLKNTPYLFELMWSDIETARLPKYSPVSKFPSVERDIAVVVDCQVMAAELIQAIQHAGGRLLNKVRIFDIYMGEGIESGKRSVALGLTFQDPSRTLIDEEINQIIERVVANLERKFNATLRA